MEDEESSIQHLVSNRWPAGETPAIRPASSFQHLASSFQPYRITIASPNEKKR